MKKIITPILLFLLSFSIGKAELLSFSFTSQTTGQVFAPRHVLAVWIEKEDGTFVKTLYRRANNRIQYLYTWNTQSSGNSTDAVTGATLNSHGQRTVYWNGRDLSGNAAPSGKYKVRVEFTEKHAQGPLYEILFDKDTVVVNLNPANQTNYTNISLTYDPLAIGMETSRQLEGAMQVFPNPAHNTLNIFLNSSVLQSGKVQLISMEGKALIQQKIENSEMQSVLSLDISPLEAGVYFLVFRSEGQVLRKKVLIY